MAMTQDIVIATTSDPSPEDLRVEIARTRVRQVDIAQRVGVSEGQLSRLLSGRKPLTNEMAVAIRDAIAALRPVVPS
jgi:plasmid maintenance system antidote protein VapI